MSSNPNDYNPEELRGGDGPAGDIVGSDGYERAGGRNDLGPEEVLRSSQYRELMLLQQTSDSVGFERPYLNTLPKGYSAELVVLEWLEFLFERVGFRGTMDALRYYRSIGWITEPVEGNLREYLSCFEAVEKDAKLNRSDHVLSLVYVARLAALDQSVS